MLKKILFAAVMIVMSVAGFSADRIEVKLLDKNGSLVGPGIPVSLEVAGTTSEIVWEGWPHRKEVRRVVWSGVWLTNGQGKVTIDLNKVQVSSEYEDVSGEIEVAVIGKNRTSTQKIQIGIPDDSDFGVGFAFKGASPKFAPLVFSLENAPQAVEARALAMDKMELDRDVLQALALLESNRLPVPYMR